MKKIRIVLIVLFVIMTITVLGAKVFASDAQTMNLNITDIRPYTPTQQYKVVTANVPDGHSIFKIIKKDNNATEKFLTKGENKYVYKDSLYCLRSGLGFGDSENVNSLNTFGILDEDVTYTQRYNLKTQATDVMAYYANTLGYTSIRSEEYNSILWIIDNMYLPEHVDASQMKEILLNKVLQYNIEQGNIVSSIDLETLTDNDIEFVQQMALWYYSNYDTNGEDDSLSLSDGISLAPITRINDEQLNPSDAKSRAINSLYKYFVENAEEHSSEYIGNNNSTSGMKRERIKVNESSKVIDTTTNSGFTIIGPFSITQTSGDIKINSCVIEVKDKNGEVIPVMADNSTPILYIYKDKNSMAASDFNTIEETVGEGEFYLEINNIWQGEYDLSDVTLEAKCQYEKKYNTTATLWIAENDDQPVVKITKDEVKVFDLALRKYITKINNVDITRTKNPNIDVLKLKDETTADYKHRKSPVEVKTGDKVTYKVSVYNEGELDGIVTKIIDYLPEGLVYNENDNTELSQLYNVTYNQTTRQITITPKENVASLFELNAYDGLNELNTDSLNIICTVVAQKNTSDKILTNIATMEYRTKDDEYANLEDWDSSSDPSNLELPVNSKDWENYEGNVSNKRDLDDSNYFYEGQEDDDDFDKVIIRGVPVDFALRKFITKVNNQEVTTRIPEVDTTTLDNGRINENRELEYTATYTHSKKPVIVKKGDIVTYKIRVYNEGAFDGYATKVADHIPEGLGYLLNYKTNTDNYWRVVTNADTTTMDLVGEEGLYKTESAVKNLAAEDFYVTDKLSDVKIVKGQSKISSTALDDEVIKAYNPQTTINDIDSSDNWQLSTNGINGLYYRDIEITCIVLAENYYKGTLRNIAEIESYELRDGENNVIENMVDRDSVQDNVDKNNYNPQGDNSTYQEDDDDYELLELKYFDLALRKFITGVNEENIDTREPVTKKVETGNDEFDNDDLPPVYVSNSDIVTYTLRVYNQGTVLGYATEIEDDIPDGVVFLPEHPTNSKYEWKMYDKNGNETQVPTEAVKIRTKYLENTRLNPFDPTKELSSTNPDNAEVKVAFLVVEENITQEDRIIINKAQITKDKPVEEYVDQNQEVKEKELDLKDEDSIPDEWNEGEDDQDIEKIYVKKFDLALLKWVTKTIVTVDEKTTITDTGFTPEDNPEPIAKVVIDKKKLNKTTVKFVYNIIVTNQGEIDGYATEITDYIPEGLEFIEEDNPLWEKESENKITTRALEGTLLEPGESATLEVTFTWKNNEDNLGLKTNTAEISEDYNDRGAKDIDSDPDNVENIDEWIPQEEDDDDRALVMLELKTGGQQSYIWLGLTVLLILAGGIALIKKYVI